MKQALVLLALLSACGSRSTTPRAPITAGGEVHAVGEGSVVLLTRPHAEQLLVELWIDAGSIDGADAGGPEVASLAAWIAEARAGASVHARVVPDGTVFRAEGASLADLIDPLMRALATREPTEGELAAAREILRARRRGRARDPLAALEVEASAMLLGPSDPLGSASESEVDRDAVRSFFSAHYGPARARWVVVGDLDLPTVRDALSPVGALPAATHEAGTRRVVEGPRSRALDEAAGFSIAVIGAPSSMGGALGLGSSGGARFAHFPTPCGELGLLAREGPLDEAALRALRFALSAGSPTTATESDARADAERAGLRFVARPERCAAPTDETFAWVISAPDHAERRRTEIDAFLRDARSLAIHHEDVDGHSRLLSITLRGGSLEDPASMHGRAALVARALAARCDARASVEPEATRITVDLEGTEHPDVAAAAALRCLLLDPIPNAFFEAARAEALDALDADARFLAAAAMAVSPSTPGLVAPLGDAAGVVGASALADWLATLRASARIGVALIGPEAPDPRLEEALGALRAGEAPELRAGPAGPSEVFLPSIEAAQPEVIVTLRLESERRADARAVAAALSAELDATALAVQRYASGHAASISWVAIALSGPDAAIDDLDALLRDAVARADLTLEAALEASAAARESERVARSTRASEVARRAFTPDPPEPDPLASRTLLRAPPHRVVVRPSTPPVRRR